MAWYDFLTGTPARTEQLQRFNPQQQAALSQILQQGTSGLKNLQKGFDFKPIEQQARSGFEKETVPGLAERFTSMGSNALSSPAFASQLGQAGAGLEQSLAALKSDVGLRQQGQQQNLLQNLLSMGLQPQTENLYHTAQPGALQQIAGPALQALMLYLSGGTSALGAGLGGLASMGSGSGISGSSGQTGLGGTPVYSSSLNNPAFQTPALQNLLKPF